MAAYIIRRIVAIFPVMLVVATVVFVLVQLAPGDPVQLLLGPDAPMEDVERLRSELGLDKPLLVQFTRWLLDAVRGDFGESLFLNKPVWDAMVERLEPTILLTAMTLAFAVAIGVPAGVLSAAFYGSVLDQALMFVALLGVSMPEFWLGLNLIVWLSVKMGLLPVAGYVPLAEGAPLETLRYLVMPALALGFIQSALVARMARATMLEVLAQDYIRTARAKGLDETVVTWKHALRNALIPIVTVVGLVFALTMGGAIVIETIFNLPGVGRLLIQSVLRRDYPLIQGIILYLSFAYVFINLLVDLLYVYLNPRLRYT